jgi:hypothetical protein
MPHLHKGIVLHRFALGDCEDPELYAAQPIWEWEQSDHGRWVKENCYDPRFLLRADTMSFGYQVLIVADMSEENYTFHELKWGNRGRNNS